MIKKNLRKTDKTLRKYPFIPLQQSKQRFRQNWDLSSGAQHSKQ
jgi:hypothetical protein